MAFLLDPRSVPAKRTPCVPFIERAVPFVPSTRDSFSVVAPSIASSSLVVSSTVVAYTVAVS